MEISQSLSDVDQLRDGTLKLIPMDCEGQGAHQTNAIGIWTCLYVFHGLSTWHPFRHDLERIDRNAKAPEDVLMVQLHP